VPPPPPPPPPAVLMSPRSVIISWSACFIFRWLRFAPVSSRRLSVDRVNPRKTRCHAIGSGARLSVGSQWS
jgi:hypothetical protein